MNTYAIVRRRVGTPEQAPELVGRSSTELAKRTDQLRWIRSYVLEEPDGQLGTICIYQATGADAIREHGEAARIPVDEVLPVVAVDVQRPDPEPATT